MHVGEHSKNGPWPSPSGVRADNTPSSIKLKYAPMFLPLPTPPSFTLSPPALPSSHPSPQLKAFHNRMAELPAIAKMYEKAEGLRLSYKTL